MKTNHGFALIFFLILLPVVMSLMLGSFFIFEVHALNFQIKNMVIYEQLKIQLYSKRQLTKILSLNPLAQHLRQKFQKAKVKWIQALNSNNIYAQELARLNLERASLRLLEMDLQQKDLLKITQEYIHTAAQQSEKRIHEFTLHQYSLSSNSILSEFKFLTIHSPKFALVAQDTDPAPTYVPSNYFQNEQKLTQTWKMLYKIKHPFSFLKKSELEIQKKYETTLIQKERLWVPIVL